MSEKLTYNSIKESFGRMGEILFDNMVAAVRMEEYYRGIGDMVKPDYIREYTLDSAWYHLLEELGMISPDSEAPGITSLPAIEQACLLSGMDCRREPGSGGEVLVIHMRNHDYGVCDAGDGAYGGPQDKDGHSSGGIAFRMTGEEFVQFVKSFDELVPDLFDFIDSKTREARSFVKAEEVLQVSLESRLKPELEKRADSFDIEIDSCNPKNRTVEIWIDKPFERGTVILMTGYEALMENPGKYLDLGCRAFDDPGIPEGIDFLPLKLI